MYFGFLEATEAFLILCGLSLTTGSHEPALAPTLFPLGSEILATREWGEVKQMSARRLHRQAA